MSRSTYIPVGLLMLITASVSILLFVNADNLTDRNVLRLALIAQGVFIIFQLFRLFRAKSKTEPSTPLPQPIKLPKVIPARPRTAYQHHSVQPKRSPARSTKPLSFKPTTMWGRNVKLPPLPELLVPVVGRSNSRSTVTETSRAPTFQPARKSIRIDDLLPPTAPTARPQPKPPEPKPTSGTRVKCPKKYTGFEAKSSELPAKITLNDIQICSNILTLGYYCAASDGSVTSQEDDYLKAWSWCVIEKTSDSDSHAFHKALGDAQAHAIMHGKKKLNVVAELANVIRATGEKKFIQCAGYLCSEIIECDDRLDPGEFPTLSTALKHLGIRNIKAEKIAKDLLFNDDDISELKSELDIDAYTTAEEREFILSREWSKLNGRMQVVSDSDQLEEMKQRMMLIQKIRDLYREIEGNE